MNKTQLINQVCRQTNCSRTAATQIVNACFTAIKKNTKSGKGVNIAGFGRFWCDEPSTKGSYRPTRSRTTSSRNTGTNRTGKTVCFKPTQRW